MEENTEKKALTTIELIEQLKDTEEFQTLVNNRVQKEYDNKIGSKLKEVYQPFDNVIKETLGVDKPSDEYSSEWYGKHIKELAETKQQLKAFKEKKDGNVELEKIHNDKYNKLKKAFEETQQQLKETQTNSFKETISNSVDKFLVGKTFDPSFNDSVVDTLISATKSKIVNSTKRLENGKVAVLNAESGEYYTDALGEPLTPQQVAKQLFEPLFFAKKTGGAATTTADINTTTEGEVVSMDMTQIKTRSQFQSALEATLAKKGYAANDKKTLEITRATRKHYNVKSLPLD